MRNQAARLLLAILASIVLAIYLTVGASASGPDPMPTRQLVPFHATGSFVVTGSDGPYVFRTGTGWATHLGAFQSMRTVRIHGRTVIGTETMEGSNGDSIHLYFVYEFDKDFFQGSGYYVITGGTGRYQNASGEGTVQLLPINNDGSRPQTWDGTIEY